MKGPPIPLRQLGRHGLSLLLFVGAASAGFAPTADGDIWWHLAAGREMVARGGLLFSDPFSVSAAGRPWIDVHWLFQLLAYAVHGLGGLAALVWLKCAAVGIGALTLRSTVERQKLGAWAAPLFATLLVAALFAARSLILLRPVIVTLVCLALFFRELERFRADGKRSHLYWLVALQVVWANCQGLSALGPAVVAIYAVAAGVERRAFKPLLLAGAGCVLGSLLTPFGVRGPSLSARLFERLVPGDHNVYAHTVAENVPPFLLERWSGGELWHLKWFFALLGVALVVGGRRLRLHHALLLTLFGGLALLANRNVLLFYWMATPIAALHLAPAVRRLARFEAGPQGTRFALGLNTAALCSVLALTTVAGARESGISEPSPFRAPAASAQLLASLPAADVFSADHHGGYLIWALYPRFRPYIDTRLVLRTADEYADYLALADFPERFAAFQERHHFGYVVLPVAYPDRYLGLVGQLYRSPNWKLIFTNGSEVLFARSDLALTNAIDLGASSTTQRLVAELETSLAHRPKLLAASREHLAMLDVSVGEPEQAEQALLGFAGASAETLRARCRFRLGDLAGAEHSARSLLAREPSDVASLSLLAQIAVQRGDHARGLALVRRALRADPFDAEAGQILASLQENTP